MQPWRPSFATDYKERGNYPNPPAYPPTQQQLPYMYPPSPSPKPNYNRAAQPFQSLSSGSSAQQQQSAPMQKPNSHPSQYPQSAPYSSQPQSHYQDPSAMASQMSYQQQSQSQQGYEQQSVHEEEYYQDRYENLNQQRDPKREEPDMDEDFPSFKELRSKFLDKEKETDGSEKKLQRKVGKLGDSYRAQQSGGYEPQAEQKKPPPLPKKPAQQQQSYSQPQQQQQQQVYQPQQQYPSQPQPNNNQNLPSQDQPQQNQQQQSASAYQQPQTQAQIRPQQQNQQKKSFTQIRTSSRSTASNQLPSGGQTPSGYDQMDSQPSYPPSSGYREIPVHHISSSQPAASSWSPHQQGQQHHQTTTTRNIVTRQEMGYRPPMSINVSNASDTYSYDSPSPRVVITSNSPRSPQKATYRPGPDDYSDLIVGRRRRHSVTISPNVTVMNSFDNQPRRRTSYAEITLSGANSLPRNFTMRQPGVIQRSVSQVSTRVINQDDDSEFYPGFNDVKQHFTQNEVQGQYPRNFGVVYGEHMSRSRNDPSQSGFTRVSMRRSSLQSTPTFIPSGHDSEFNNHYSYYHSEFQSLALIGMPNKFPIDIIRTVVIAHCCCFSAQIS